MESSHIKADAAKNDNDTKHILVHLVQNDKYDPVAVEVMKMTKTFYDTNINTFTSDKITNPPNIVITNVNEDENNVNEDENTDGKYVSHDVFTKSLPLRPPKKILGGGFKRTKSLKKHKRTRRARKRATK